MSNKRRSPETTATVESGVVTEPSPETTATVESGKVRMRGGNCSVEGVGYAADENGVVVVDESHAAILQRDHGFSYL